MVEIYFGGKIYDLTNYIENKSITFGRTGDKTLDSNTFKMPDVHKDTFEDLDMSRALPRNARVRLEIDGVVTNLIVEVDNIKRIADTDRYEHTVSLTSPSKLMVDTSSAGFSVTQPQGDYSSYFRSVSKYDDKREMMLDDTYKPIEFTTRSNSSDFSILDGRVIKGNRKARININFVIKNNTHQPAVNINRRIDVKVKIGSYEEYHSITAEKQNFWNWIGVGEKTTKANLNIDYYNTGENLVSVELMLATSSTDVVISLAESTLSIYTGDSETMSAITLDYVVEKLLNNEMNAQKFYLDDNSKALLSTYSSYEWTIPNSYLWLQVMRIADYIKAFPRVYYESDDVNSRLMLELAPFDSLAVEQTPPMSNIEQSEASIDDYTSAVEINVSNVYSPNVILTEETTLRVGGDNAEITTENLIIPTKEKIGTVHYIMVRLRKQINTPSGASYSPSYVHTLTEAVFDKRYYDTLPTDSDYTLLGRQSFNQNNTMYFIEGEKDIRGCSNLGGRATPSTWNTNTYVRAIYEAVLAKVARAEDSNPNNVDDGETTDDNLIEVLISYSPYVESNAVIFKEDQSGFSFKTRKILNESMAVNNPDIIGTYAQGVVNRSGGTKHTFGGVARLSQLPDILSTYQGMVLFSISITMLNEVMCSYILYYVKDFVFISSYESYDKKERIYQTPKDNLIERVIKKNNLLILSEEEISGNEENYQRDVIDFFKHLTGQATSSFPRYAMLRGINGLDAVDIALPVSYQTIGRTIEYRIKPKDNYSAGLQKYNVADKWYQKDFLYTNLFGRIEDVVIQLYTQLPESTVSVLNDLPKSPAFNQNHLLFYFDYNLRKDAREIPVFSFQYSFLSESDRIVIYDNITDNCSLIDKRTIQYNSEIKTAELDYIPLRNAKFIDLTRANILEGRTSVSGVGKEGKITILGDNPKPIAIFNNTTLELMLVDKRALTNRIIYVRSDDTTDKKFRYKWEKVTYIGAPYDYDISINGNLPLPTQAGLRLRKVRSITDALVWRPTLLTTETQGNAVVGATCNVLGATQGDRFGFDDGSGNMIYPLRECKVYGTTTTYDYYVSVVDN